MTAFAQSPQALFGVLIALECGMDPVRLATSLGQGVSALLDAAEEARAGRMPRQMAWGGDRMASELLKAGPQPTLREEVLVKRWMRRIARHMHQHGEISLDQVRDLVDTESETASIWMNQLRHQFRKLGLKFTSEMRDATGLTYVIQGQSRDLLAAIIADDWKIEVVR